MIRPTPASAPAYPSPPPRGRFRAVGLAAGLLAASACAGAGPSGPTEPPVVTADPAPRVVPLGTSWTFTVAASGSGLRYQWRRGGLAVPGATASAWTFRPASLGEGGSLDVVVSNAAGADTSAAVEVRVVTAQGPWTRGLLLASGAGPDAWGAFSPFVGQAGVPSLARLPGGRIIAAFQWFPYEDPTAFDRVAVALSDDGGRSWTAPRPIVLRDLPAGHQRPFDPTVTVTAGGQVRLYFTSSPPFSPGVSPANGFYSALSADGVEYAFESGVRFFPGRATVDCAALLWRGRWHLVSPVGAPQEGAYHAVSDDGLAFVRAADIPSDAVANWTGNLVAVGEELRFYGTSSQGVWYAASSDGFSWRPPVFLTGVRGGDPAVVEAAPGRWLMVVTG